VAVLAVAGCASFLLGVAWYVRSQRLKVVVVNTDREAISAVRVVVAGNVYELGSLEPSARASVRVHPMGESGIDVIFANSNGRLEARRIAHYVEGGYCGSVVVTIAHGAISSILDDSRPGPPFMCALGL
jgi:hypothetical protein